MSQVIPRPDCADHVVTGECNACSAQVTQGQKILPLLILEQT